MDLNEQAQQAVKDAAEDVGVDMDAELTRFAKIVWLDGYKDGLAAVEGMLP